MTTVLGVDGDKAGWIGILLVDGVFRSAHLEATLDELVVVATGAGPLDVVAIDMPIGWCLEPAMADPMVRKQLPGKASSVFSRPTSAARSAASYAEANALSKKHTGKGLSAQAWALMPKMIEATGFARETPAPVIESHPELSFALMADGNPAASKKRTWAGHHERRRRLESVGICVPDDLGDAGACGIEDVLDAAAVAWTAGRWAAGTAISFPDPADTQVDADGVDIAIWG